MFLVQNGLADEALVYNPFTTYDFCESPFVRYKSREEGRSHILRFGKVVGYRHLEPIHDARRQIRRLKRLGATVYPATARVHDDSFRDELYAETMEWLDEHFGDAVMKPYLILNGQHKADLCGRLGLHVFVDDHPETINRIAEECDVLPLLFDESYNRTEALHDRVKRARGWARVVEIIKDEFGIK